MTIPDDAKTSSDADLTRFSAGPEQPTKQVGPYRLLRLLGEGGMGEVWLAEQTSPVHRQVAFKVIKAGMDTARVVRRFEAERQALALMSHPSIAQVFDGGATPEGRPFFAMEYVAAEPITSYCARKRLTTRQRIDLFLEVCDGVQHAHQKGIIHRDLKPSNILVAERDDRPVPKIIDFGVAKATRQSLTEQPLHTEFGSLIGTPEYMSPEQAELSGLDVDTRTDVYALGVILYELLTGVLPFSSADLRDKPVDDIRRIIREVDPLRPSTRLTSNSARSGQPATRGPISSPGELRGDLDWITMRAIEKDRRRRYGSASDLAADLRRHLDYLPVLATPPTAMYRVQKFVRRHRFGTAAAVTAVLVLFAFATTMAIQARRVGRERDRANLQARVANEVANFMIGLFRTSDPRQARGKSRTAREILDSGAAQLDSLKGEPEVQSRLQAEIGRVYLELGDYAAAETLLKRALTFERQTQKQGVEQARVLNALANVYWYQQRYTEALPLYQDAHAQRLALLGPEHVDTLKTAFDLASLYAAQKEWEPARKLLEDTLAVQRRVLGEKDNDVLSSMNNLAFLQQALQHREEARALFGRVFEARLQILGADHPDTLTALHNVGSLDLDLGRFEDAELRLKSVLAGRRRVLGPAHTSTLVSTTQLARLYRLQHRYRDAEGLLLEAYSGAVITFGAEHARATDVVNRLAVLYDEWGKPDKAAEWRAKLPKSTGPPASR